MKKSLIACCLLSIFASSSVLADAQTELQSRLNKVSNFNAHFTQTVKSAGGVTIQEGEGQLWVKRPNLFRWHMISPDESILVSDGKTLWFYNPFVEQVTATWLNQAASNTPFMLITRNQSSDWSNYSVKQNNNTFDLTPKKAQGSLRHFSITVNNDGAIESFVATERDDQTSAYQLKGQQTNQVDASKFTFTPPKGVTVDDQRK